MDRKIFLLTLLSVLLVISVIAGCAQQEDEAVENVRKLAEALPTVEEFTAMDADAQQEAYLRTQTAYDAYMTLDADRQGKLKDSLGKMEALFSYFNTLIMPIAE